MTKPRRPRVAAIGLNDSQIESIVPLCGDLRAVDSMNEYRKDYSWTETDVMVSDALHGNYVDISVNLIVVGPGNFYWSDSYADISGRLYNHSVTTDTRNTERELEVSSVCPALYGPLAAELSGQLSRAMKPPAVIRTTRINETEIVETTSGCPVALRLVLPPRSKASDNEASTPIVLLLPADANLAAWFRVFLCEVHESDPTRVPHPPPRLSQPSDWYTPEEKVLADRISKVDAGLERLNAERDQLEAELVDEGERADQGIRRALWSDGDELIAAIGKILTNLGFAVRNMDAELPEGEPKHEDLRLTREGVDSWEAMVEVKGYTSGTKTNDARQIREHRERYIAEERCPPDLTVWLANPHRRMDPSARPAPDQNVRDAAANIGSVHVLAPDLYRQWALVASGSLDAEAVIQSLVNAEPGLWVPRVSGSRT